MKKTITLVSIIALVSLIIFTLAGCKQVNNTTQNDTSASRDTISSDDNATKQAQKDQTSQATAEAQKQAAQQTTIPLTLYFGDDQGERLIREVRQVPETSTVAKAAVEELIKGPKAQGLSPTIPPEAKLLNLDVIKGVAYVNFSAEFVSKHWGGSTGEQMTVSSIADTLTEFKAIQKVQIMVDGKIVESIAGHLDISQPIPRDESIISATK